eukprot:COSAG02_NODE_57689_length_279_cov_36.666667_1_plen_29_part_10
MMPKRGRDDGAAAEQRDGAAAAATDEYGR